MGMDSSTVQAAAKRTRPEDEVYLDNFHSQKRYLSEVMASSLNCLKVGDTDCGDSTVVSPAFDLIDSPAITENCCLSKSVSSYPSIGDEVSTLDSYMSDDSDDSICFRTGRFYETPQRTHSFYASPLKPSKGSTTSTCMISSSGLPLPCTQTKQRNSDPDSRFPPSPSDPCHGADLRKAALLRSLQIRAQSPVAASEGVGEDASGQAMTEPEDQCSPSSPNFDDLSAEQGVYSYNALGSPVHGTFPGQGGRVPSRARSLQLDEFTTTSSDTSAVKKRSLSSGMFHVYRRRMDFNCDPSNRYKEDVSESTDKFKDSSGRRKSTMKLF